MVATSTIESTNDSVIFRAWAGGEGEASIPKCPEGSFWPRELLNIWDGDEVPGVTRLVVRLENWMYLLVPLSLSVRPPAILGIACSSPCTDIPVWVHVPQTCPWIHTYMQIHVRSLDIPGCTHRSQQIGTYIHTCVRTQRQALPSVTLP